MYIEECCDCPKNRCADGRRVRDTRLRKNNNTIDRYEIDIMIKFAKFKVHTTARTGTSPGAKRYFRFVVLQDEFMRAECGKNI